MNQTILRKALAPLSIAILIAGSTANAASTANFSQGDKVVVAVKVNVRNSANGVVAGQQGVGATGTIIGGPVNMAGYTWWNIDYTNGADGWSAEDFLQNAKVSATVITNDNFAVSNTSNTGNANVAAAGSVSVDEKIAALTAQLKAILAQLSLMTGVSSQ